MFSMWNMKHNNTKIILNRETAGLSMAIEMEPEGFLKSK